MPAPEREELTVEEMDHIAGRLRLAEKIIASRYHSDPEEGKRYAERLMSGAIGALEYESNLCKRASGGMGSIFVGDSVPVQSLSISVAEDVKTEDRVKG